MLHEGHSKVKAGLKTREDRQAKGVGDCIDCGYCVQACPVGIDIRNGMQYQCISCALCIDACDTIMDNLGWPRGLIKYTSEKEQQGGKTRLIKGFEGRSGKKFDARLRLDEKWQVAFEFPERKQG